MASDLWLSLFGCARAFISSGEEPKKTAGKEIDSHMPHPQLLGLFSPCGDSDLTDTHIPDKDIYSLSSELRRGGLVILALSLRKLEKQLSLKKSILVFQALRYLFL